MPLLIAIAMAAGAGALTGCVTKRTTYDDTGAVVDEQYIVKRPVKQFVKGVEFE